MALPYKFCSRFVATRLKLWLHRSLVNGVKSMDELSHSLLEECGSNEPGATLSAGLRSRLENLPLILRRKIASASKDDCTPLFLACKNGHVDIVEYLITICDVDIEQRGIFELEDSSDQWVTPLWCAAVSGRLSVTKCLIKHGANINAVSDTGSTPLRSACFMTHIDIVTYLVEQGADVQIGNYNGGTCLINSVQSVELCAYLLKHGADVNAQDIQGKTALHYAVQERQLAATILLLEHRADPYTKNRWNDDALQLACLKGAVDIFHYLTTTVPYSEERLANAHELIGSTLLDEFDDVQAALNHWRIALSIRNESFPPLEKLPVKPPRREFLHSREFRSEEELNKLAFDLQELWIQSLLICERILGCEHKNFVSRLMYRGAAYADIFKYQRCVDLWKRNLEIMIKKDSILFSDTCLISQVLVHMYMDFKKPDFSTNDDAPELKNIPRFEDLVETLTLLADQLPASKQLLQIRPINRRQEEHFDRILRCVTHLIFLLLKTVKTEQEERMMRNVVTKLIQSNPRSAFDGDTLLHLCLSRLNTLTNTPSMEMPREVIFPNLRVIQLLLDCGAPINAVNEHHSTPLHVASNSFNYFPSMVNLLLENGAHLDQSNCRGETPQSLLLRNKSNISYVKYGSLKCLAANVVISCNIQYKGNIPASLETFIRLHEPGPSPSKKLLDRLSAF